MAMAAWEEHIVVKKQDWLSGLCIEKSRQRIQAGATPPNPVMISCIEESEKTLGGLR